MNKLILPILIILVSCESKTTESRNDIKSNPISGGTKSDPINTNRESKNFCFRDYDCLQGYMDNLKIDTAWNDNFEIIKINLKLTCNKEYSHIDTMIYERNSPCESDSVIYRYKQNNLSGEYSFKGISKKIEITPQTLRDFIEDKSLSQMGYIGNSMSLTINKADSSLNLRLPIYFREIDVGEIVTVKVDKMGQIKFISTEKYAGFVPD